jgi:hypothetical protein
MTKINICVKDYVSKKELIRLKVPCVPREHESMVIFGKHYWVRWVIYACEEVVADANFTIIVLVGAADWQLDKGVDFVPHA